jgi:unsaturated rhamnogalacturonyl hydrolase
MKKFPRIFLPVILAMTVAQAARAADAKPVSEITATPIEWSRRLADDEIARRGDNMTYKLDAHGKSKARWDYAASIVALGCIELSKYTGDMHFAAWAEPVIGSFLNEYGEIATGKMEEYSLDVVRPAVTALALYNWTGDERYRKAADIIRVQLDRQPRTLDDGFWHKLRYQHQMWLDGLYMGEPFYAEYVWSFSKPKQQKKEFDDIAKQFLLIGEHTYDPKTGLFYHAWDEGKKMPWANKQTGASPSFWSRAIGWYAMAFVDTLEFFPADHPKRPEMIAWFKKLADGLVKNQDAKSGLWWQVTDQGGRDGNYLEATASSMFVYALAKGVNAGYLPRADFEPAIRAGYAGLLRELVRTDSEGRINLTECCRVAGLDAKWRDGSFDYYASEEPIVLNDPKGVGPFILAGFQLEKLFGANEKFTGGKPMLTGWELEQTVVKRIFPPKFAAVDFSIVDYGAVADGKTDCTKAIAATIDICHEAGGGRVIVPAGVFFTGAIHLKSNVNLHLEDGATLLFSTDPAAYPTVQTRYEGVECMNYSPLIYAFAQRNVAVTGKGTLDGQADYANWWGWVKKGDEKTKKLFAEDRKRLFNFGEDAEQVDKRIFGAGHYLRPNFIQPYRCTNVLIEGITVVRSPMWEINPVLCKNVTVRNVNIKSHGPNNDGCDPESCRDVLIEGCTFDTGDDCIAIKSGRNADGRRVGAPAENIVIRNCTMKEGHGGVTIGSEISGDCRNVFAEDCKMDSPNLQIALRIKTNAVRGGTVENIYVRNIEVGQVADAVIGINFRYEEGENGPFLPVVRNINVENLTSGASKRALALIGFEKAPIKGVHLLNCTFNGVKNDDTVEHVEGLEKTNVKIEKR